MSSPSQVEFYFCGPPMSSGSAERTYYASFSLNGVEYKVGDHVFLYPEDEGVPPYVGKVLASFVDTTGRAADPHCVEVAWYERRAHLEPADFKSAGWERELVALEETDINPIGCISGKAVVLKAVDYEEACSVAKSLPVADWFFCRGVYKQAENRIAVYPELLEQLGLDDGRKAAKRPQSGIIGEDEGVADSDDVKRQKLAEELPVAPLRRSGKLVSGRTCVECGATQTPQWREGPAGPKTLCNACGVRYVRAQQRANKRSASVSASRSACGSGGRQSRTSKAARAEAAAARSAARTAAAAAADEASQRPLRQAALMAASKTAQFARTGVFPQSAEDLQQLSGRGGGSYQQLQLQQHYRAQQQQQLLQQQLEEALSAGAGVDAGANPGAPPEPRPDTPNCSSLQESHSSAGSHHEGVAVEVVVGPAEGEAEACGSAVSGGGSGGSGRVEQDCLASCGAMYPVALGVPPGVLLSPAAAAAAAAAASLPMPVVVPAAGPTRFAPGVSIVAPLGVAIAAAQQQQQQQAPVAAAAAVPAADARVQLLPGAAAAAGEGCNVFPTTTAAAAAAGAAADAPGGGCCSSGPAASGSDAGCAAGFVPVGAFYSGCVAAGGNNIISTACSAGRVCCGVDSPAATAAVVGVASAAAAAAAIPPVMSVPVSPNARCDTDSYLVPHRDCTANGGAGCDTTVGCMGSLYGSYLYGGSAAGGFAAHASPFGDPRVGGGEEDCCGSCGALAGLGEDEYGPLVEVDFGLGPADVLCGGGLFDDLPAAAGLGEPSGPHCPLGQGGCDPAAGVDSVADLPSVAARAAPFCPELTHGSEARQLLDAMPLLLLNPAAAAANHNDTNNPQEPQEQQQQQPEQPQPQQPQQRQQGPSFPGAAGVAGGSRGAVPEEAVSELLELGRQASRAATEAEAADAALQAVSQVLETHQEAARRARQAATARLDRIRECMESMGATAAAAGAEEEEAEAAAAAAPDAVTAAAIEDVRDEGPRSPCDSSRDSGARGGSGSHAGCVVPLTCLVGGAGREGGVAAAESGGLTVAVRS
ncbi:hypothetical protein Agub_g11927 [Astrephomene gubernaculifera]|uniref:GATA-type domain-containing protein n=1 Tax=Astrephomene gubernaculifera TaxID=47775 RepID=A0AAD3DZ94_9CHLO|nr:hypothetical protein Agub_g11927 [Astrephomene gubernaculifera]